MGGTWFGGLLGGKDKEIETARASYATLQTEYNQYDKKYSILSQDNDTLKKEYTHSRTEWDGMRAKLEERTRKWETDYHSLVADNEASRNDWLSEKKVFLSQMAEADDKQVQLKNELATQKGEWNNTQNELKAQIVEWKNKHKELEREQHLSLIHI